MTTSASFGGEHCQIEVSGRDVEEHSTGILGKELRRQPHELFSSRDLNHDGVWSNSAWFAAINCCLKKSTDGRAPTTQGRGATTFGYHLSDARIWGAPISSVYYNDWPRILTACGEVKTGGRDPTEPGAFTCGAYTQDLLYAVPVWYNVIFRFVFGHMLRITTLMRYVAVFDSSLRIAICRNLT
ncbi:hypothetical protein K505DRAFT_332795 [Melanomma pulvis-pyrius CBS 109.77]|uniref:Uncharacterized protein n=1 Tax=Melanomma pulvis-pyrius CBS 109.77 TaxID=1314802 RepID=A0A6A6XT94_9PLEO|nr:hypothetical protein K505DRAFT_332795 [Melanomma pulvis-pyrius CBS 109.77]